MTYQVIFHDKSRVIPACNQVLCQKPNRVPKISDVDIYIFSKGEDRWDHPGPMHPKDANRTLPQGPGPRQ